MSKISRSDYDKIVKIHNESGNCEALAEDNHACTIT